MKLKHFILICFFLSILLPFLFFTSLSKYQFEYNFLVAKLKIDNSPPKIELISFNNSNSNYPNYANKTHKITAKVKIIENHISEINFDSEHIKIKVGKNFVPVNFEKISCISSNSEEQIYEIIFSNIPNDGLLNLCFLENSIIDTSLQSNLSKTFYSNILIDNTAPVATFEEKSINDGYSEGIINVNESIHPINSWNMTSNNKKLTYLFPNSIEYELPIKDFAQNSSSVLVSIKNASNINLEYGIYDAGSNNVDITTCGNISGDHLISSDKIFKAESIFVRTFGKIDTSILKGKIFLYTYYGEGSSGICPYSELKYNYGYNPKNSWRTINKENTTYFLGKLYTQFGGTGLNYSKSSGQNPIPEEIAKQYLYGISGIFFSLDDYSKYSIVYQIYIKDIGWLSSKYNGQEIMYNFDKPISAIRINFVPNSERQYLIDYWNKSY